MEYVQYYLQHNIILLLLAIGVLLLTSSRHAGELKHLYRMERIAVILLVALSVIDTLQMWAASFSSYTPLRPLFTYLNYILLPVVIFLLIMAYKPSVKITIILIIPLVLNVFAVSFGQLTHWSVYYDANNVFQRGDVFGLGYFPHIISLIYVVILLVGILVRYGNVRHLQIWIVYSAAIIGVAVLVLETLGIITSVLNTVLVAGILFYNLYHYTLMLTKDPLTKLYNRGSFYFDVVSHRRRFTYLLSMDINGLKGVNDTQGHAAGDKMLVEVSKCFVEAEGVKRLLYRTGGDEFLGIVLQGNEAQVRETIDNMRKMIEEKGYSCSFGYARNVMTERIDSIIAEADARMYEEKHRFYKNNPAYDRRKRKEDKPSN